MPDDELRVGGTGVAYGLRAVVPEQCVRPVDADLLHQLERAVA